MPLYFQTNRNAVFRVDKMYLHIIRIRVSLCKIKEDTDIYFTLAIFTNDENLSKMSCQNVIFVNTTPFSCNGKHTQLGVDEVLQETLADKVLVDKV